MANAGDVTRLFNLLEIHYTDKTERDYNEIRHLLESGVDPNALQPRAQDPVLLEAYYPHPPSSWPHLLVSPLYLASLSYDNKAINLLIEFGARFRLAPMSVPSEQRDTVLNPLMIPIFRNYLGTLHLILGVFDDDDLDDCTEDWKCQALVVVLRKGWFEKANILLHYDANLMRSTSPTFNSVEVVPHGLTHLVQELPKLSLALLFPGYEIHQFVHAEDSESHQAQSSMNVSVNSTDFGGCTALHIATGNVDERMCKYFIEGGADVNYLDELGLAPLHYATFYGHETATQFLLENGADVHLTANTNHSTPSRLEVAALDTIRRRAGILATFADLNWSAVHIAAYRGYSKIVTLLLKFGANGSTRDAKGALPLDIALKHRHTDTCIRFAAQGLMFSPFSTTHLLEQAIAWGDHELAERILITFDLNGTYDSSEIQEQKAKIQKLRSVFKLADTVLVRQTATSVGQRLEGPHLTLCPNCELELHGSKQYSSWERILSFYEVNSYCKGCQLLHDAAVSLEKAQGSPEPVEPKVMTDLVANLAIDDSASQNSVYFDWCFLRDQDTRIESLTLRIEDRAGVPSVKSDFHHSIYTVPDNLHNVLCDITVTNTTSHYDSDTGSSCSLKMAAHWLRSCIKGHASCIQSHGKQYSPTRVVDLQHADGSEVPRLLQHVELDEPYVALSHRWGMTGLPATTRVNLQQRLRSIPVAELSPILRDVVVVTRELGFRYIWVDALCIIQDSESDWLNEASKMSDVYSGASLTIAAAEAEGHSEGMFRPRRAACFRPFYIDRHKGVPHRKRETPNGDGPLYVFPNTPRVFSGIRPKSTLDSRGWVLQEQLLSPRILYFGDGELFWDCITMSASESWPVAASLLADSNSQETWALKTIRRAIASGDTSTSHLTRLQDAWRFITANYSARQLTKAADKLIAINGILSSLATIFDDAPVAGMWRKDIWRQLIWWTETPTPIERPSRIPSFIAPTWSWLNSKGPIRYHNATYSGLTRSQDNATSRDFSELHPQCVVIDVHSNDNSAGEITGLLTIKGPCFDYNLRKDDMKKSIQKRWNQAKTGINAGVWLLDEKMELPQVVRCLVMAEDPVAKVLVLLCLVPVDDKDVKARYKRIGLCHWDGLSHEIRRYAKQEPVDKTLTIV